jgi:hypothetical protein
MRSAVYGAWESVPPQWTHRSYLYSLPPIGKGTAAVESFTGYIARLAAAHAVEAGVLVNQELLPRVPYTKGALAGQGPSKPPRYSFYLDAYSLNGAGERSRLWVSLLEQLTCVERLDALTALPWARAISCVHLLRTQRAWCPLCYGAQQNTGPAVYERLLWAVQIVTVCPEHRCPLETICRSCGRTHYVFSPKARPGFCSRCQCWLGREPEAIDHELAEPIRIAEMVGELLSASPRLPAGFGLDQFRENTRILARKGQFRGPFRNRNVRGWMNRGCAPRMDSLALLSRIQEISMLHLLTEKIVIENVVASQHQSPYAHYRVAGPIVENTLRATLLADVPRRLEEIAADLGYRSVEPLQSRFRDLCRQIVEKRAGWYKNASRLPVTPLPKERIEQALSEALEDEAPVNLRTVAAKMGLRNKRRLYKGFHDLRRALVAKNRRLRSRRWEPIESALRAALDEAPVPTVTDVARRLGLKSVTRITKRFPDLSAALKRRRHESPHVASGRMTALSPGRRNCDD